MTLPSHLQIHSNQGAGQFEAGRAMPHLQVKGFADGEDVILKQKSSSPSAHAMEEATFALSQREKDIKNRKIKDRQFQKTDQVHQAEFYHKKLPDLDMHRLHDFFEQVKKSKEDPDELAQKAGLFFKDVSHQYAALRWTGQKLAQENTDPQLVNALKKAAGDCLSRNEADINAGLNISEAAHGYAAKGFGELQGLRDLYRETVTHAEGLEETCQAILKRYSHKQIPMAIEFLMTAAGSEMRSQARSVSKAQLKSVIDELYWLKFLSGLHQACTTLLNRMKNQFGLILDTTAPKMLAKLINLKKDPYLQSESIIKMADGLGISDSVTKIDFLRECNDIVNTFPEKTFQDNNTRQHLVQTFREAMDTAIDSELENLQ